MNNLVWQRHAVRQKEHSEQKGQTPFLIWFTGLSGAGKSTLANALEVELYERGFHTYLLDGDNVRHGLNKDLGFSEQDRVENIRRVGEVSHLMVDAGLIVVCAFISPLASDRQIVRELFERQQFIEVYVNTPLQVCERRDPKGLYEKARNKLITQFTGIDSPYEAPNDPEVEVTTDGPVAEGVSAIVHYLTTQGLLSSRE